MKNYSDYQLVRIVQKWHPLKVVYSDFGWLYYTKNKWVKDSFKDMLTGIIIDALKIEFDNDLFDLNFDRIDSIISFMQ